jgi:D-serine ammonia-lyase
VVGKVSQEHGILVPEEHAQWEGSGELADEGKGIEVPFTVGQKVRVLPNHACIVGAHFPFYFVVEGGEEVVDVWVRCRGW